MPLMSKFFRIEFYRICIIYRICRKLFLVVLKMKITKNGLLQILYVLSNTIFSNFENENSIVSVEFNSEKLNSQLCIRCNKLNCKL